MRLAVAGVGNNISALVQGIAFYRTPHGRALPGVTRPVLGGIHVTDVDIVAAFDVSDEKTGRPLSEAIVAPPNNYPVLNVPPPQSNPTVSRGIQDPNDETQVRSVVEVLEERSPDVLLYSLPTGYPEIARAYGEAAVRTGVAVVNCTPDPIARIPELLEASRETGVPLLGDDLQSHLGSSVVHGTILALLEQRGVTLAGSYQLNCGGNADFDNLRVRGEGKEASKHNALRQKVKNTDRINVVPSAAYVPHLMDRKVGHIAVEGLGWANMPVRLDLLLQVQDSSNAAGVIIDLIRIAAASRAAGEGGFQVAATPLLKSPPIVEDPLLQADRAKDLLTALASSDA